MDRRPKRRRRRRRYERNVHRNKLDLYLNQGLWKSRFPLNLTDRRTNISMYRVASQKQSNWISYLSGKIWKMFSPTSASILMARNTNPFVHKNRDALLIKWNLIVIGISITKTMAIRQLYHVKVCKLTKKYVQTFL